MGRIGREIRAIAPEVRARSTRRCIGDGKAGGEGFTKGEAEGDVMVGAGIRVVVAVPPAKQ